MGDVGGDPLRHRRAGTRSSATPEAPGARRSGSSALVAADHRRYGPLAAAARDGPDPHANTATTVAANTAANTHGRGHAAAAGNPTNSPASSLSLSLSDARSLSPPSPCPPPLFFYRIFFHGRPVTYICGLLRA